MNFKWKSSVGLAQAGARQGWYISGLGVQIEQFNRFHDESCEI
jgi:hypothetical protein